MKLNFKDYLIKTDATGSYNLVLEGLREIKPMIWSNMNLQTALEVAEFSPAWNPDFMKGNVKLDFPNQSKASDFVNAVSVFFRFELGEDVSDSSNDEIWQKIIRFGRPVSQGGASYKFKMTPPEKNAESEDEKSYRKRADQKFSAEFGQIMKAIGAKNPALRQFVKKDKSAPDVVEITSDENAAEIFRILKNVDSGSDATDAEVQEFLKSKEGASSGLSVTVQGYYNALLACYIVYDYVMSMTGSFDVSNAEVVNAFIVFARDNMSERDTHYIDVYGKQYDYKYLLTDAEYIRTTDRMHRNGRDFEAAADMTINVDEQTRWLLKSCNQMLAPDAYEKELEKINGQIKFLTDRLQDKTALKDREVKSFELQLKQSAEAKAQLEKTGKLTNSNIVKYLAGSNIAVKMAAYDNKRNMAIAEMELKKATAKENKQAFDEQQAKKDIPQPLINFKSIDALTQFLGMKAVETGVSVAEAPTFGSPCAQRRMKLFDAARHKGAEVYTSRNWVVCKLVQSRGGQAAGLVFGRNKPKVEATDRTRTRIITAANMEDWEGITAANKQIRDGGGYWVYDNIGHNEKCTETGWCTALANGIGGAHPGSFTPWEHTNYYSEGYWANGIRVIIMDARDGRLYQFGGSDFLAEEDDTSGIIAATRERGISALKAVLRTYKDLNDIFEKNGISKTIFSGSVETLTDEALFAEAVGYGLVTKRGGLKVRNSNDVKRYDRIKYMFSEYAPFPTDAAGASVLNLFYVQTPLTQMNRSTLPPINCQYLKSTKNMFCQANVQGPLVLRNTGAVTDMTDMFKNSRVESVEGLNTSSAVHIDGMFQNCKPLVYKFLQISEFDLSSCETMNFAFRGSALRLIDMKNTDKVKTAVDAFKDCFMLERIPTGINFKGITAGTQLASDFFRTRKDVFGDDFSKIFTGCAQLPRKLGADEYEKAIDELAKWYKDIGKKLAGENPDVLVVNGLRDIADNEQWLYDYKVVKITNNVDSVRLFSGRAGIRIRTLDVSGRTNIDNLFYDCRIKQIDRIVGTENITNAFAIFDECTFGDPPPMNFPKLATKMQVFYNMQVPNGMPRIEFGSNVIPYADYENPNNASTICRDMIGDYYGDWDRQFESTKCVEKLFARMFKHNQEVLFASVKLNDSGYLIINDSMATFAFDIIKAHPEAKGVLLDFSGTRMTSKLFQGKKFEGVFPKIDFNHKAYDCQQIFEGFECKEFAGFENTEKLTCANAMFKRCKTNKLPVFDVSGIEDARQMFSTEDYTRRSNFGDSFKTGEWNFKSVQTAERMFMLCGSELKLSNLKFGPQVFNLESAFFGCRIEADTIDFPAATNCDCIFQGAMFLNKTIKKISLPAYNARSGCAFNSVSGVEKILEITMDDTLSLVNMFSSCASLKVIGKISAEQARDLTRMFSGDTNLKMIMVPRIPYAATTAAMFDQCPLRQVFGLNGESFTAYNRIISRRV